jgi:hypothetical protein
LINLKWSGIAGGFGLLFSFLVGVINGAGFPLVLIRALIFGIVFFILGGGIWMLINNFVPELLFPGEEEGLSSESRPGSRLDISVGGGQESALPELYGNSGAEEEVGNISDLLNGTISPGNNTGMDQKGEDGYTDNSGTGFQSEVREPSSGPPVSAPGDYDSAGVLPDLDSMAEAFIPSSEGPVEGPADRPPPERKPSGNKPQNLKGDFNPKELAAAIRTKINKE